MPATKIDVGQHRQECEATYQFPYGSRFISVERFSIKQLVISAFLDTNSIQDRSAAQITERR